MMPDLPAAEIVSSLGPADAARAFGNICPAIDAAIARVHSFETLFLLNSAVAAAYKPAYLPAGGDVDFCIAARIAAVLVEAKSPALLQWWSHPSMLGFHIRQAFAQVFFVACDQGNLPVVKHIVHDVPSVNTLFGFYRACSANHRDVALYLLHHPATRSDATKRAQGQKLALANRHFALAASLAQ